MAITREEAIQILSTRDWSGMLCGYTSGYSEALDMAIEALSALPSAAKKLNNQTHLCDSCKYNYPKCPSENEDVLFGSGVGNDNICCCAKYITSAEAVQGEWIKTVDGNGWNEWYVLKCPLCGARMRGGEE